jgi:hypothetical protein
VGRGGGRKEFRDNRMHEESAMQLIVRPLSATAYRCNGCND